MNNTQLQVDASSVYRMFDELNQKNRKRVKRAALSESSRILINETKYNLRQIMTKNGRLSTKSKKRTGKTLEQGIKRKYDKNAEGVTIHIKGDFRLKWFELGTAIRRTKGHKKHGIGKEVTRTGKGGNRGLIKAYFFFRKAKEAKEKEIFSTIDDVLEKHIKRINAKYHNK